jgi:NADPH:quinone reductase-like Zn-dependent oxidoreductase
MFAAMNRAVALQKLKPTIDRVFNFADAKDAYLYQQSGRHFGKIVISMAA